MSGFTLQQRDLLRTYARSRVGLVPEAVQAVLVRLDEMEAALRDVQRIAISDSDPVDALYDVDGRVTDALGSL